MAIRKKHPDKDIEKAVCYAEQLGWRYKMAGGSAHAWGRLLCPLPEREGCSMSVWSTPRSGATHAKQVIKQVNACEHTESEEGII